MKKHKKIKCHVMTMYDWLKKNHPEDFYTNGNPIYCPFASFFGLVFDCRDGLCNKLRIEDFDNEMCIRCWQRPFRGIKNDKR